MSLFDFFGISNHTPRYSSPRKIERIAHSRLSKSFSMTKGEDAKDCFVLTTTEDSRFSYFGESLDGQYYQVCTSLYEVKEAMQKRAVSTCDDSFKIIGFQVNAVGRELTDYEKQKVEQYKREIVQDCRVLDREWQL